MENKLPFNINSIQNQVLIDSKTEIKLPNQMQDMSYANTIQQNKNIENYISSSIITIPKNIKSPIKLKSQKEIESEFSFLKKIIDDDDAHYYNLVPSNRSCRYSDIRTYKNNTVQISNNKYINASFVHIPNLNNYIATQGPLESTCEDFWTMIYDYNVNVILMLCSLNENGYEKCANYWEADLINFDIKIIKKTEINKHLIQREIQLTNKNANKVKCLKQLQFIGWPDHGVPNVNLIYDTFIEMMKIIYDNKSNSPCVVHCSAGVGRTGTFICCINLCEEILRDLYGGKDSIKFSVLGLVRKMKEMRLMLVENIKQYFFIYGFIEKFLENVIKG